MQLRVLARHSGLVSVLTPRVAAGLSWACLGLSLLHALDGLAFNWDMPLLDRHSFRQTQTAITARSFEQGGPLFAYETPILGAPWSIPFEFPLYQWLVAGARAALGTPLDQTGRLVNSAFYLATLLPLWHLLRALDVPHTSRRLTLAFFLTSPLYVYWSRAFLIESTVLFFSVAACALGLLELEDAQPRPLRIALAGVCAVLAAAVKPTTAFGWLLLLGAFFGSALRRYDLRRRDVLARLGALAAAVFVAPVLAALAWTHFADGLKSENLLARDVLVSAKLDHWVHGTWSQRTSVANWVSLLERTLDETLGHRWMLAACALMGLAGGSPLAAAAPLLAIGATYAAFINLHLVHDYYQCATGLLLIVCIGVGLAALERVARRVVWIVPLCAGYALLQSSAAYAAGYRLIQADYVMSWKQIAQRVRARTPTESTILIYGLTSSPEVPYYAERRAIMNRYDLALTDPRMHETLARTARDGHPVGAVLACREKRDAGETIARAIFQERGQRCDPIEACVLCTPAAP